MVFHWYYPQNCASENHFLIIFGIFFSPQAPPTPPKAHCQIIEGETNLSEHPLEMTTSPAKS